MTRRLLQFGTMSGLTYAFPQTQSSFTDNFASAVPATVRLPGLSGGYDQYGAVNAPQEIGSVKTTFTIVGSIANMDTLRDAVKAMTAWGLQRLYYTPAITGAFPRWCYARVNNISMSQNLDGQSDNFQRVTIDFQVSDPHWYSDDTNAPVWGDGIVRWGDGTRKWGGLSTTYNISGTSVATSFIGLAGTDKVRPRVKITIGSFTVTGPVGIDWGVNGTVLGTVYYTGSLTANKVLEIDTHTYTFYVNNVADYSTAWVFNHPDIISLQPVAFNYLRFFSSDANPAHTWDATFYYNKVYF